MAVGRTSVSEDGTLAGVDSLAVVVSEDGLGWERTSLDATGSLKDVAYGDGTWIAVGRDDAGFLVMVSDDGRSWRKVEGLPSSLSWAESVAWGGGRFVALAYDRAEQLSRILTSPDGRRWTVEAETNLSEPRVVYGGGSYVIHGSSVGAVLVSADGIAWEVHAVPEVTRIDDLVRGPDGWIATGMFDVWFGEEPGRVRHYTLTSGDGEVWSAARRTSGTFVLRLAAGDGALVGLKQADALLRSTEGLEWEHVYDGEILTDVVRGEGLFVAVGRSVVTSPRGRDWTLRADFRLPD